MDQTFTPPGLESLDSAGKLNWALEAVLEDDYEVCDAFVEYLHRQHAVSDWCVLADRLLARLDEPEETGEHGDNSSRDDAPVRKNAGLTGTINKSAGSDFRLSYERDRLSDWAIFVLERAGRKDEIIPLCEAEAKKTGSYLRLAERLIAERRFQEAERWIKEGIVATKDGWPGIAANLRLKLREIRVKEENWPAVAAMLAEELCAILPLTLSPAAKREARR